MAHPQTPETRAALVALLDWYVESGVDIALDEAPHDRYADSASAPVMQTALEASPAVASRAPPSFAPPSLAPQPPAARPRPAPSVVAPDEAAQAAEAAAASARNLEELAAALASFPHAPFRDMAQHFLFSAGRPGARLMAFDAAPGATEETTGEAFSGRHAALLDNMLKAIRQNRESAYLAYVAPWRPAGDRALTPQEAAIFAPFARRHVELARPEVLLLFGEAPARAILGAKETVAQLRGKAFEAQCGAHKARAFVFSSLDSLLRTPAMKPAAWRDLRVAEGLLG